MPCFTRGGIYNVKLLAAAEVESKTKICRNMFSMMLDYLIICVIGTKVSWLTVKSTCLLQRYKTLNVNGTSYHNLKSFASNTTSCLKS